MLLLDEIKEQRVSRITIPEHAHPVVRFFYGEMRRQNVSYGEVEHCSGVYLQSFKAWRHSNKPGFESLEAVLGALGWQLLPVPHVSKLPETLQSELRRLAQQFTIDVPDLAKEMIGMVVESEVRRVQLLRTPLQKLIRQTGQAMRAAQKKRRQGSKRAKVPSFAIEAEPFRPVLGRS
jgi:hypothetical protein